LRSLAPMMARRPASKSGAKGLSLDTGSLRNQRCWLNQEVDLSQLKMDVQ
jgi:hypothetical protein